MVSVHKLAISCCKYFCLLYLTSHSVFLRLILFMISGMYKILKIGFYSIAGFQKPTIFPEGSQSGS